MITLLGWDKCRPVHVPEDHIDHMEELVEHTQERDYPFTRIYIKDVSVGHEYSIDVVESIRKINQVISEKQHKKGDSKREESTKI